MADSSWIVRKITEHLSVLYNIKELADTDYLAVGVWAWLPDDRTAYSEVEIGAFADESGSGLLSQNIPALTGRATYNGEAGGIYTVALPAGEPIAGLLLGTVVLTANFDSTMGAGGSMRGTFSPTDADGGPITIPASDGEPENLNIMFDEAAVGGGGFFTGSTSVGTPSGFSGTGKWGGQFYGDGGDKVGDHPDFAAGTFAGDFSVTMGEDTANIGYIGAFITER